MTHVSLNVRKIGIDFIKHRQIVDDTAFLKRLPVQICLNSRDAAVARIIIKYKVGSSPFERLNGRSIFGGVW